MKKKIEIEIDKDDIIDVALNLLIVATAAINTAVDFRSPNQAKLLDMMTLNYLACVVDMFNSLNINWERSDETLNELKKSYFIKRR